MIIQGNTSSHNYVIKNKFLCDKSKIKKQELIPFSKYDTYINSLIIVDYGKNTNRNFFRNQYLFASHLKEESVFGLGIYVY